VSQVPSTAISTKLFRIKMKYALLLLVLVGCASEPKMVEQQLIMDKQIQSMGRSEIIDAVKQCETSGLRAITVFGKRKINGYTAETIVDVTCGPKFH
jgi:hypothetical protein